MTAASPRWWQGGLWQPLDDGAVLFDPLTWQTHLLNPATTALVEALFERFPNAQPTLDAVRDLARSILEWDTGTPAFAQTVAVLREAGLVRDDGPEHRGSGA